MTKLFEWADIAQVIESLKEEKTRALFMASVHGDLAPMWRKKADDFEAAQKLIEEAYL